MPPSSRGRKKRPRPARRRRPRAATGIAIRWTGFDCGHFVANPSGRITSSASRQRERRRGRIGLRDEGAEEGDEQSKPEACDQRAADRADAAEHDDHEGHDDLVKAHAGQDRRARRHQRRPECDRRAFEHEDAEIDDLGVDAEQLGEFRILGDRADHRAEPGSSA